ncbi:ATP synthase subunit B [Quillaja saponaria]|uniref:ATP synthase subunit B n=1 Tax=Quillaja saponaria TaxID=32244 RepID=A0AAD7LEN7_QUISA|nr:ATP synthase subunit B [Quillaja saponaria]
MEELRKLEQVQRTLQYMESRGIITSSTTMSDLHSNRFLANFVLFLIQPCGELDMEKKCSLISEHIPKISATFLGEEFLWLSQEGVMKLETNSTGYQQNFVETTLQLSYDKKKDFCLLQSDYANMLMVGLDSMQHANSTLEDFCRSYFMFHGLDVSRPQSIFKYIPVLSFTESFIYQLDKMNEKLLQIQTSTDAVLGGKSKETTKQLFAEFPNDPFRSLLDLFKFKGLLTERIKEELKQGEEYWALERKLCCALTYKEEIHIEDVMKAIHLKSFDYRVLNLLLYQLRDEKVDELHMEFLSVSEFLVEVADDLFDYEDDVLENNFNILRMFVKMHGASTAPIVLAKYISEAEEKYDSLLKLLDPQLSLSYQGRCEEATMEGGKASGHPLGTWIIPNVIVDEELYRLKLSNDD